MLEPVASEPPFEILIRAGEPRPLPAILRERVPESPGGGLRPERWLFVIHLLVLASVAGLVVCIVGLVRASRAIDSQEASPAAAARQAPPEASASTVAMPAVEPAPEPPPLPPKVSPPPESTPPAQALRPGAEGPSPAGSKPQAAPPAPAADPQPAVDTTAEPEFAVPEPEPKGPAAEPRAPASAEPRAPAPEPRAPAPPQPPGPSPEELAAKKILEEAHAMEPTNPSLAATRYRRVLELLPGRTDLWKTIADLELTRGAAEEAGRAYREFLHSHPDRADALQNLAIVELRSGRPEEARICLEAAIKLAPSADLYYNLGNVHLKGQGFDAAIVAYRRALEYDPRHTDARFNMALALERLGKRAEAVSTLAQLGSVSPEVVRERARMEAMMGGLEAERALGLARTSTDVEMVVGVATGFREAGELEKSLALLDHAVELAPRQASVRLNRGAVRQAMGLLGEASSDYEESAGLDPALPEARFNLGVLAEERGQYVAALGHYAAALKINPAMACALNNVGALYLKVGQPEKAIEWFRRCGTADSSFAPARLNMAWAHLALGSKDQAMTVLRAYLQDVPKEKRSPDAQRVLSELEGSRPGAVVPR